MDPIDEDFLVGLAITGERSPQSASEMDRFVRLEQEGYVQAKPGLPMTFSLTLKGRAVVEAKRGRTAKGSDDFMKPNWSPRVFETCLSSLLVSVQ